MIVPLMQNEIKIIKLINYIKITSNNSFRLNQMFLLHPAIGDLNSSHMAN